MERVEPKTLAGFMELLPEEQVVFNHMRDVIRHSYETFGFLPLDTPIIEYSEVLLAKAGGETEKQIYRFTKGDTDLSLRFDLTVPLAKFVAQNLYQLSFPFRRYQIGKVFRGERPQKGRYREFYQCDIDIIGDGELSILNDAEIPSVIYTTFRNLGFERFTIRVNNRKVLGGFFEALGYKDSITDILRIIDKVEKIGYDAVREELATLGVAENAIEKIIEFVSIKGNTGEVIEKLLSLGIENEQFQLGVEELKAVSENAEAFGLPKENYKIDLTIARGLDYYTGTVYETVLDDYPQIGSVCSGGRYDNLAEFYTDKKLPGVGISIGLTRLYYQLKQAGILGAVAKNMAKVMIIPMLEDIKPCITLASGLRAAGINTEIYYNKKNMKGKFNYANKLGIPYVIVIGEDEIQNGTVALKNMETGEQQSVPNDVESIKKIVGE
ncbi:MAG: histidine--tRNA ligase [Clostridia bacterium]|nr:histidine--tRNA ligase [Clostridia bacterium]